MININHNEYQAALKTKPIESLYFIMNDAAEAARANPEGEKAGYYLDEVHYAAMEIQRRKV